MVFVRARGKLSFLVIVFAGFDPRARRSKIRVFREFSLKFPASSALFEVLCILVQSRLTSPKSTFFRFLKIIDFRRF